MKIVIADYETYFDRQTYTLSKMSTESYIRDPRFRAHGCAVKWGADQPARWLDEPAWRQFARETDWSDVFMIHHHAQFDSLIDLHHYGVNPAAIGCTLSMARLLLGNHLSVSLDAVRKHFGMSLKTTPYHLFDGKKWENLDLGAKNQIADGACDEVESIWTIFNLLARDFPKSQYEVVDILIRMFVNPVLCGDIDFLAKVWEAEASRKADLLQDLGITPAELQSADRFAELLREQGVEPETKEGKKGDIYAFAKTDEFMQRLLEDPDEIVVSLAQARLGIKSNIQQTRAETIGYMATRGPLCVYIRPYGTKTTRPSGGDKSNFLNMKKDDPDMPPDDNNVSIKKGICAPPGYLLAAVDASQIECRLVNFIAGQDDVIEKFRCGEDPYVRVASEFYGFEVNKRDHPTERQVGKVIELQAGYGSGGEKIRATLRNKARIIITPAQGVLARDAYRNTHPAVTDLWKEGGRMIARLAGGPPTQWGPVEIRDHRMYLPNGAGLIYDTLEYYRDPETADEYWRVKTRKGWEKTYGAKLVENLCQATAWCLVSDAMVRIARLGYRVLNAPYDELLCLIPDDGNSDRHAQTIRQEMIRPIDWLPGLPLDAEVHVGREYSK